MKCLFAHDHRFIPGGEATYSESQFGVSAWDRYLEVFDRLTVVAREGQVPAGKSLSQLELSSRPEVSFRYAPNLSSVRAQLFDRPRALAQMRELVSDCDAVIATVPTQIGLLAITAAQQMRKPYAVLVTGCAWDGLWNYGSWRGKAYAPVMFLRMRRAVARSPFVFYVTRKFLQRRYPCATGRTVGCSDVEIATPDLAVLAARRARGSVPSRLTFGLIGTLRTKYKGIQTVMESLAHVRRQLPPFDFRVLGGGDPGPWRALARSFGVDDVVHFDGTLSGGTPVLQWLDGIDVYLQPSFKEGLPRALVEAMSRACPAIGSRCAGIPELLPDECLIEPGDVAGLGCQLLRAAQDATWRAAQAERNWIEAGTYARPVLEAQRSAFWKEFADYARAQRAPIRQHEGSEL